MSACRSVKPLTGIVNTISGYISSYFIASLQMKYIDLNEVYILLILLGFVLIVGDFF